MKKLLLPLILFVILQDANAELSPMYKLYAQQDGEKEATIALNAAHDGYYYNSKDGWERIRHSTINAGVKTEDLDEYLHIAIEEMNREIADYINALGR